MSSPKQENKTSLGPSGRLKLGNLPALLTPSARLNPPDRRTLNMRWLVGTVLTGCTSIFLMGGALFAGIESRDTISEQAAYKEADDDGNALPPGMLVSAGKKGNRLSKTVRPVSHRREIQVSTISSLGDENRIATRPFMLVSASLETKRSQDITLPEFNAVRIFSSASDNRDDKNQQKDDIFYSANVEGEMRIKSEPLDQYTQISKDAGHPADFYVQRLVNRSAPFLLEGTDKAQQTYSLFDTGRFDFPGASIDNPAQNFIKVVPENMASFTKTALNSQGTETEEKIVVAVQGDTVRDLLLENEATEIEAEELADLFTQSSGITELGNNQRMRIIYRLVTDGVRERAPLRISLYHGDEHQLTVAQSDQGKFQIADEPTEGFSALPNELETIEGLRSGPRLNVYDSLNQTALKNGLEKDMVDELVRILSFDVDFKAKVKPGDSIQVFHSIPQPGENRKAEILFAEIQLSGKTRRYYRYRTADDGRVDYYDENGRSAKKFLMRKPVQGGKFRSPFGWRRHPILKVSRLHKGVDWSARRGTPIMASGNGRIIKRKWSNGYGNYIQIQHTNGYATGYAHMSGFSPKFKTGDYVRQGEVIGYIGSTGLSTGPHLHYEVTVNGRHVDPMRIRLPRGRSLKGNMLATFQNEQSRINELLGKSSTRKLAKAN